MIDYRQLSQKARRLGYTARLREIKHLGDGAGLFSTKTPGFQRPSRGRFAQFFAQSYSDSVLDFGFWLVVRGLQAKRVRQFTHRLALTLCDDLDATWTRFLS